jgi:hypothetical protein
VKNNDDPRLLAHKRRIDEQRKAAAIAKRKANNIAALHRVGQPKG